MHSHMSGEDITGDSAVLLERDAQKALEMKKNPYRQQWETSQMWACIGSKEYDFGATHRGKTIIFQGGDDPDVYDTDGTVSPSLAYQCQTDMDKLKGIQRKCHQKGKVWKYMCILYKKD